MFCVISVVTKIVLCHEGNDTNCFVSWAQWHKLFCVMGAMTQIMLCHDGNDTNYFVCSWDNIICVMLPMTQIVLCHEINDTNLLGQGHRLFEPAESGTQIWHLSFVRQKEGE